MSFGFKKIKSFNRLFFVYSIFLLIILISIYFFDINLNLSLFQDLNFNKEYKISLLNSWYGIFLTLALISSFFVLLTKDRKNQKLLILLNIFIILLITLLLNISASIRISVYLHLFIALFVGYFVSRIILISNKKNIQLFLLALFLIVILIALPLSSQKSFKNYYPNEVLHGTVSSFYYYEFEMGEFIKKNANSNSIIVSDPGEQLILSGISGIFSFGGNMLPKEYMFDIKNIILNKNDSESYSSLCNLFEDKEDIFLVISGRSIQWAKDTKREIPIYQPVYLEDTEIIQEFKESKYFDLVHSINNQIYLFKLKSC